MGKIDGSMYGFFVGLVDRSMDLSDDSLKDFVMDQ